MLFSAVNLSSSGVLESACIDEVHQPQKGDEVGGRLIAPL